MDRKVLRYLADLALVRQQANNVLSVGRGMIDQKTLHKVSAKTGQLDSLFANILLGAPIPGESGSQVNVNNDDLDYIDVNQRIKEAKAELNKKNQPPVQAQEEEEDDDEDFPPKPAPKATAKRKAKTPVERPDEEVEAFQKLLAEAEAEVEKAPTKTTKKKTSRRGKKVVSK